MSTSEYAEASGEDWGRLAQHIRERREVLGLSTRRELAQVTGLSYRLLGDLERGARSVSDGTLSLIEQALDWLPGSAREILRGGEPALHEESPRPKVPEDADWMRSIGEAYRIAADLTDVGQRAISKRLTQALSDISQFLIVHSTTSDEDYSLRELRQVGESTTRPQPTVLGIALGRFLRSLRNERRLTSERVAELLGCRTEDIWFLEIGYITLEKGRLRQLLILYGRDGQYFQREFMRAAEESVQSGWWARHDSPVPEWLRHHLQLEKIASLIRTFEANYVPALLQTRSYASAIIDFPHGGHSSPLIERRMLDQLDLRMKRQSLLKSLRAPNLWAIIGESAVDRTFAAADVIQDQISHLIEMSQKHNVVIQILPREYNALAGFAPSFTMLRFPESQMPDIVYTEQFTSALYLDKKDDVDEYKSILDLIAMKALDPRASINYLRKLKKDYKRS